MIGTNSSDDPAAPLGLATVLHRPCHSQYRACPNHLAVSWRWITPRLPPSRCFTVRSLTVAPRCALQLWPMLPNAQSENQSRQGAGIKRNRKTKKTTGDYHKRVASPEGLKICLLLLWNNCFPYLIYCCVSFVLKWSCHAWHTPVPRSPDLTHLTHKDVVIVGEWCDLKMKKTARCLPLQCSEQPLRSASLIRPV